RSVKYIRQILEDRQREEFFRLKIIRRVLERRRKSGAK
ncbi:MAG: V-type ATP synthase subunit D, partial [Sulfolobaceae archaeon]